MNSWLSLNLHILTVSYDDHKQFLNIKFFWLVWTYSEWETDIPDVAKAELKDAEWINVDSDESITKNPIFMDAGKFCKFTCIWLIARSLAVAEYAHIHFSDSTLANVCSVFYPCIHKEPSVSCM